MSTKSIFGILLDLNKIKFPLPDDQPKSPPHDTLLSIARVIHKYSSGLLCLTRVTFSVAETKEQYYLTPVSSPQHDAMDWSKKINPATPMGAGQAALRNALVITYQMLWKEQQPTRLHTVVHYKSIAPVPL